MKKSVLLFSLFSFFILCFYSLFAFPLPSAFAACPTSMTSYWKLDTENQGPYKNEIDPAFNGLCGEECPTLSSDAAVVGAQDFNGSNTEIDIPASLSAQAPFDWEANDSFTIEFWVKRAPNIVDNEVVIGRAYDDDNTQTLHWWIGIRRVGTNYVASFNMRDLAGSGPTLNGTTTLNDDAWHHIVAIRDAQEGKNYLYVDAVLEAEASFVYNTNNGGFKSTTADLNIGWLDLNNSDFHFDGIIDEIALYNIALEETIIKRHFDFMKSYCEISLFTAPGVFRKGNWYLDANGNGVWDRGVDTTIPSGDFGSPTDVPITGDWNGDGQVNIGVFRRGAWFLDYNGNGIWDPNPSDPGADKTIPAGSFGLATDKPVTGDWNGDGRTKIGIFRQGKWALDYDGNYQWNPSVDKVATFGAKTDIPITGDWDGDGKTQIATFRAGSWFFDANNNYAWDRGIDTQILSGNFGTPTDTPITGDWDGNGKTKIGIFRAGAWALDFDGDNAWDRSKDIVIPAKSFGAPTDIPITGHWPSN